MKVHELISCLSMFTGDVEVSINTTKTGYELVTVDGENNTQRIATFVSSKPNKKKDA